MKSLPSRVDRARQLLRAFGLASIGLLFACGRRAELLGTVVVARSGQPVPDSGSAGGQGGQIGQGGGQGGYGGSSMPAMVAGLQFSPPVLVTAVSDPNAYDADPTFTGDLLDLFFMSDRAGSKDLWTSHRLTSADPWGPPTPVTALNSSAADEGPTVSLDGLRIWFVTEREVPYRRIWHSSRASRGDTWAAPQVVTELASSAKDFGPAVDASETLMFFSSNRPGTLGMFDVFSTSRASTKVPWGAPRPVPGLNGPYDDKDPFVAEGGLVVFYTSTRSGAGDLFWSQRQSTNEAFPTPVPLVDVNSPAYDSDPTLSLDLGYLMFDSARTGISDIYESHAVP